MRRNKEKSNKKQGKRKATLVSYEYGVCTEHHSSVLSLEPFRVFPLLISVLYPCTRVLYEYGVLSLLLLSLLPVILTAERKATVKGSDHSRQGREKLFFYLSIRPLPTHSSSFLSPFCRCPIAHRFNFFSLPIQSLGHPSIHSYRRRPCGSRGGFVLRHSSRLSNQWPAPNKPHPSWPPNHLARSSRTT